MDARAASTIGRVAQTRRRIDGAVPRGPESSLASGTGTYALADKARTKIVIYSVGVNDSYDEGGGPIEVKLPRRSEYRATWMNPRTGAETEAGVLEGGRKHVVSPPSSDDWVLLLARGEVGVEADDAERGHDKRSVATKGAN